MYAGTRNERLGTDESSEAMTATMDPDVWRRGASAEDWRHQSACQDEDRTIFFPTTIAPDTEDEPPYPPPEAKEICDLCPVRKECLEYALENRIPYGIFGGQSAYERSLILRPLTRKRCPGCGSDEVITLGRNQVCVACAISWDVDVPLDDAEAS